MIGKIIITIMISAVHLAASAIMMASIIECIEYSCASSGWRFAASICCAPIVICMCYSAVFKALRVWGIVL